MLKLVIMKWVESDGNYTYVGLDFTGPELFNAINDGSISQLVSGMLERLQDDETRKEEVQLSIEAPEQSDD